MDQAPYDPEVDTSGDTGGQKPAPKPAEMTPMMAQFFEIKSVNPGYLLFYRMGDFYELFFEDAEIASAALGIVLTKRGKHQGDDIPMCGVPIHAANDYLSKLINLGHKVAICEQVEDPAEAKKRDSKSVVKRDVVRLVTPGTLTEDDHLAPRANNFLAALAMIRHGETDFGLAWADISTGEVWVSSLTEQQLGDELARIGPAELVVSETMRDALNELAVLPPALAGRLTIGESESFDSEAAPDRILEVYDREAVDPTAFSRAGRAALGGLLAYVADTQKGVAVALRNPQPANPGTLMAIDQATRNSLELLQTNRGETKGSLRHAIDLTVTPPGSRLLARRLAAPLCEAEPVNARLDMVETFVEELNLSTRIRAALKSVPDLTRALTRLALDRGGPRDLKAIGEAVSVAGDLADILSRLETPPKGIADIARALANAPKDMASEFDRALDDDPSLLARDGGFVREGYDETLDTEKKLARESRSVIAQLQASLVEQTGVKALKIKHNNVLGFFVEVPSSHGDKLVADKDNFIHRQTMANAMRFTTTELAELEGKIARAGEAALKIELDIFGRLNSLALLEAETLRIAADALAELDVATALANLAAERSYVRPLIDSSTAFAIEGGRHPVVEPSLASENAGFVANNCDLSGEAEDGPGRLWLVTGPNMGGKSTFLRQNALIAVLAQMGSYVPAASAHIGVIDRVFSRVGASDDIAHGRSTFMVEMVETAAILNRATRKSLVVLDEIGRGTSTFDGLSIAWACVEALHETTGCRALFATHFHELTSLSKTLPRVSNHTMKVREWRGDVVFLHEVGEGAADRSYGVQVAKLAGLPEPVLVRARQVLELLEKRPSGADSEMLDELPLFSHRPPPQTRHADPVHELLDQIRPDELTPREAIERLYELKKARDGDRRD